MDVQLAVVSSDQNVRWPSGRGALNQACRPYSAMAGRSPQPGSVHLSVTVIAREASATLAGCLSSVAFAHDVVVVDAQSQDATVEIARAAGARVFVRAWPGFVEQRNFALDQCRNHWVLKLDADERVSEELALELARLLEAEPRLPGYNVSELNLYFGRWLRHGGIYPGHHLRIFDRRVTRYGGGVADVHEDVHVEKAGLLAGHVLHLAYPSFNLALTKLNTYSSLEAEGRFCAGERADFVKMLRRPLGRFFSNYVLKSGFLDGVQGLLYCALTSLYAFAITVKLWELEQAAAAETP